MVKTKYKMVLRGFKDSSYFMLARGVPFVFRATEDIKKAKGFIGWLPMRFLYQQIAQKKFGCKMKFAHIVGGW